MQYIDIKKKDPAHYAAVKAMQEKMINQCSMGVKLAKLCPYCMHKIEIIQSGSHGASHVKCPHCKEEVFFPPIFFRM